MVQWSEWMEKLLSRTRGSIRLSENAGVQIGQVDGPVTIYHVYPNNHSDDCKGVRAYDPDARSPSYQTATNVKKGGKKR
jgi:hypothetical protein